jgi:putative PIN family toxin of toxin-antitoxin system
MSVPRLIIDTNVLVSAFTSAQGAPRQVLRRVLSGRAQPLITVPLFVEYEAVLARPQTRERCPLSGPEQRKLFNALMACTQLIEVYYLWRPNLRDEADNHVLELAVAAADAPIVTYNTKDFNAAELKFPHIRALTPAQWLKAMDSTGPQVPRPGQRTGHNPKE